ncbi:MAG: hypothetical protein K2M42_03025 [Oscillospiraceae bacterium]|nr:hypothetical protein [Oscillospiraceae bacterium]
MCRVIFCTSFQKCIDGIIVEGSSSLNTSALPGESLPREAKGEDEIINDCINMTGVLRM